MVTQSDLVENTASTLQTLLQRIEDAQNLVEDYSNGSAHYREMAGRHDLFNSLDDAYWEVHKCIIELRSEE